MGVRVMKEELQKKIMMPSYLRVAMRNAIESRSVTVPKDGGDGGEVATVVGWPLVVFINSRSGGRNGLELKERLQELMGEEQVFDLQFVKPHEFVLYGLGCLEKMAEHGNSCAKDVRQKLRVVVAGGDGTVGWVLGTLGELLSQGREPIPPTAVIPLGTGNDLSRSFGWGGAFPLKWRSAVKRTLGRATSGQVRRLDSWSVSITMPTETIGDPPHSLKRVGEHFLNWECELESELQGKYSCYHGVFYNYFSIGMDAQVAYGFHHLRNEKPYLARGPISNKYLTRMVLHTIHERSKFKAISHMLPQPHNFRGLKNILSMFIKKVNCSEWVNIPIPSSVRSIVALNLNSYASGRNPWGNLKPDYLEKRGFAEANVDDGLIEIFGLKQGWHASFVMTQLIHAKHIAQATAIRLEFRGEESKKTYMQMDGEPWKQPINSDHSTYVEINRVPFQSLMINGE